MQDAGSAEVDVRSRKSGVLLQVEHRHLRRAQSRVLKPAQRPPNHIVCCVGEGAADLPHEEGAT